MLRRTSFIAVFASFVASCGGPPCRSPSDCPFGSHCVFELSENSIGGSCVSECIEHTDCPAGENNVVIPICNNTGRCELRARPPLVRVLSPLIDERFPVGTRTIVVSGEVETAADFVGIDLQIVPGGQCGASGGQTITVENPTPGSFSVVPFIIDGVEVDTGPATLIVEASVLGSRQTKPIPIEIECPGCPEIALDTNLVASGLELARIAGTVRGVEVPAAVWRVRSVHGDVIDGLMPVQGGTFAATRLPLFAGANRIEVSAAAPGGAESRCSVSIDAPAVDRGLRAFITWDGPTSDLDLHVIGPGGAFGDGASSLSARGRFPAFGGVVNDDAEGFGPEELRIAGPPLGTYGFIVEPVTDGRDPGASAFLRVLYDGRLVQRGPIGPAYVSADLGELWVAGRLVIDEDGATWDGHDQYVPTVPLPDAAPEAWPPYQR